MALPLRMSWDTAQDRWATALNPVINCPLVQGLIIKNQVLAIGANTINHKLGRMMQGWMIVDQNAQANLYRSLPLNNLTLTLTSDAVATVSIWVF